MEKHQESGRPRKYKTPEELKAKVDAYFTYCTVQNKPKTMAGLAHALGMDRRSLINYKDRDEYKEILEEARRELEAYAEEVLLSGGKNVAGVIFSLKNNYQWTDDRNINQNINTTFSLSQLHEQAKIKMVQNIQEALPEPDLVTLQDKIEAETSTDASQSPHDAITEDFEPDSTLASKKDKSTT